MSAHRHLSRHPPFLTLSLDAYNLPVPRVLPATDCWQTSPVHPTASSISRLFHGFCNIHRLFFVPLLLDSVGECIMFSGCPCTAFVRSFVRSSGQILLPRYLMNGLSILDNTCSEYSLANIGIFTEDFPRKVFYGVP